MSTIGADTSTGDPLPEPEIVPGTSRPIPAEPHADPPEPETEPGLPG